MRRESMRWSVNVPANFFSVGRFFRLQPGDQRRRGHILKQKSRVCRLRDSRPARWRRFLSFQLLFVDGAKPNDVAPLVLVGFVQGRLDVHFVVLP